MEKLNINCFSSFVVTRVRIVCTLKLYRNRSKKRKMTSSDNNCPRSKCNLRFLDQEGLEEKITMQRKRIEKECKRESRIKESETIELVDEDHLDLMEIIKSSNISVPTNLRLLWESSTGYRWDPRFFHGFLFRILWFVPMQFESIVLFIDL